VEGESWEHSVSRSATRSDDRAGTGGCNDPAEQKGLSVFIREQLVWITGSITTPGCTNSQVQKEEYCGLGFLENSCWKRLSSRCGLFRGGKEQLGKSEIKVSASTEIHLQTR